MQKFLSVHVQSEEDQYDTCIDEQDDDPPLKILSGFEALCALQCVRNFFLCGTAEELPGGITNYFNRLEDHILSSATAALILRSLQLYENLSNFCFT